MDHKNIVICSDGTGNTTVKGRGTNVFKLFESVDVNGHRTDPGLRRQLAFYDDGVGTESLKYLRMMGGLTGWGLSRNVKQLYRELCRVYEPGDAIYLFGFSRGAFTVRTLAGLIAECGVVDPRQCATEDEFRSRTRLAYKAYRRKYRALLSRPVRGGMDAVGFKATYARRDDGGRPIEPRIRLLGVWDTVDAVGLPFKLADLWNVVVWRFKFKNTSISPLVEKACQALALDDERAEFEPVLWNEGDAGLADRIEQVWFPGCHSNVGGGYPQQGLSLVALDWMMTHAERQGLRFTTVARECYQTTHSFADKLYNPRSGLGIFYRWKPRDVQALCGAHAIAVPKVHVSAIERIVQAPDGYEPGNVPPRCAVVATETQPAVRLEALADAVAAAHGGSSAPLLARQRPWVWLGLAAYLTFLAGTLGALGHVIAMRLSTAESWGAFGTDVARLMTRFPLGPLGALMNDRVAISLLVSGLVIGYVLSAVSDRHIRRYNSAFWHTHRDKFREALRRTPAPGAVLSNPATIAARDEIVGV